LSEQPQLSHDDEEQHANKIKTILKQVDGNKAEAAKILDVNRTTLWRWIQKYEIEA
ncbi:MAG: helix-turn-helix domain-containing protein, partial [Gammaproteobacteria bacterium]|nr:helix-turn-helix domain-containing protein [Gammaproteobacteria bacterium]